MLKPAIAAFILAGACAATPEAGRVALEAAAEAAPAQLAMVSDADFATTRDRLRAAIERRPLTLFAVVDHAAGARTAGLELAPSTLFLFGDPKGGAPLMQADPRFGLELPMKMLVYEAQDDVRVAYPNLPRLAASYGVDPEGAPISGPAALLGDIAADAALAPRNPEAR